MKTISLTRGLVALVDDEDFEWLSQFKWSVTNKGYARSAVPHPTIPGKDVTLLMHRMILSLEHGDRREGEHWDLNKLNNQRDNLRIATRGQNQCNVGMKATNKSGFKGVSWEKRRSKWRAVIVVNRKQTHLGEFDDPLEAHEAYKAAAARLHGEFANVGPRVDPSVPQPISGQIKSRNSESGFVGVHPVRSTGKWRAQIVCDGKGIHLGCFDAPELASDAYQAARKSLGAAKRAITMIGRKALT